MDRMEFLKSVPADKIALVFKDYFEQHMLVYDLLRGVNFVGVNDISFDKASIIYKVQLNEENKDGLMQRLQSECASLVIYGRTFIPEIFLNGDLLCITIKK